VSDRWNPKWVTRPVVRELKVFVPGDPAGALDMHEPECAIRVPGGDCSCPAGWDLGDVEVPTEAHWAELGRRAGVQLNRTPEEWAALKQAREASERSALEPRPPPGVEPRGKTWGIRRRGDLEGKVKHAYRCPVHGVFELEVSRSNVPDEVDCPMSCGMTPMKATWAGSSCGIGHAAGEVMS
jgi:hypothetical protein